MGWGRWEKWVILGRKKKQHWWPGPIFWLKQSALLKCYYKLSPPMCMISMSALQGHEFWSSPKRVAATALVLPPAQEMLPAQSGFPYIHSLESIFLGREPTWALLSHQLFALQTRTPADPLPPVHAAHCGLRAGSQEHHPDPTGQNSLLTVPDTHLKAKINTARARIAALHSQHIRPKQPSLHEGRGKAGAGRPRGLWPHITHSPALLPAARGSVTPHTAYS